MNFKHIACGAGAALALLLGGCGGDGGIGGTGSPMGTLKLSVTDAPACVRLFAITARISRTACCVACARVRTSLATTAKPAPFSPARAASTAALRARRLVRKLTSSIAPTMRSISLAVLSRPPTAAPVRCAASAASVASVTAWRSSARTALVLSRPLAMALEATVSPVRLWSASAARLLTLAR